MFQNQLINTVLVWERKLEIDDEKRKNHRYEPYANFLAPIQPYPKERKSILARIFNPGRDRQSTQSCVQENCRETQPV